ncbi:E3 ubiquitin-protein ligase TRIM56 [Microcaecilia unicolor]|uniref:RING-type E3 ubiquitin transferase n=1 Tax=Microcaecilia unicolor TaxID=1415580 RepID=A0A6P7X1B2_9AMPH|nr:E3 ubiquitin-protein ligase TRIM56-like [Microcaecilia unicolor]XP_030044345.1 E3 ubiquitin-protein ligase TRIM56-like [Microcaecilia unicolor]
MAQAFTSLPDLIREDYLSCKICFELYKNPKLLPCLHTYCQHCLELLLKKNSLRCPECRMEVDVKDGIDSLKTNFLINNLLDLFESKRIKDLRCTICPSNQPVIARCLDCNDFLCQPCTQGHHCSRHTRNHKVVNLNEFLEGQHDAEVRLHQEMYCQDHQREPLRFFCNSCNSAICRDCRLLVHIQHNVGSMADEVQKKRPEVKKLIEGLDSNIMKILEQQKAVKESIEMLKASGNNIKKSITDYVNKVTAHLTEQKEAALGRLSTFQTDQMEKYLSVMQELQSQMDKAVNTKKFSQQVMDVGKDYEIMHLEKTMGDRIKELQTFKPQRLENKIALLDIGLDSNEILSKSQLFCVIFSEDMKTPDTGLSEENIYRGEQPENAVSSKSVPNAPQVNPQPNNSCFIPRPVKNLFCTNTFDVDEDEEDKYESKVTGIAAFPGEGGILVVDSENNEIKRFSFNGDLRRTITFPDDDITVCSVVVCGNTLACSASCYLYFLSLGGNYQHKLKLRGSQDDSKYPITSFESEYVAVSEGTLCSVSLYNTKGECLDRVRPWGYEGGRFLFIAVNSLENFIVSDFTRQQIVIFQRSGQIVHILNSSNSILTKPFSLCVDDSNNILVVDTDDVIEFSADGKNGEVLLSANDGMTKPRLVTVDSHGRLVLLHEDTQISIYEN